MCDADRAEVQRLRRKYERERQARLQAEAIAEQFTRDAMHDGLTGLPNRALFLDRAELAISRARRLRSLVAVLFLDLDGFKAINDSLGHAAGDRLLVEVAERGRRVLRPADTLARLGGDEFAVLLEDVEAGGAQLVADRILHTLRAPVALEGNELVVHASIGIAVSGPADEGPGELLRNADLAMYCAKAGGQNRHETFEPAMHATVLGLLELEADLRRALEQQEFVVHYQPVYELPTGRLAKVEALVRWQHPKRGLLGPGEFVAAAEDKGLIVPLGKWVLEQACRDIRRWQQRHPREPPLGLAVNLSAGQLRPGVAGTVLQALRGADLDPRCLTLEVTESLLMEETARLLTDLLALRGVGVRFAIDDFGTGYSSLGRLRSLPVDELKIDRSFVAEIAPGRTAPLVTAVIAMARALHFEVVAEGVETTEQLGFLLGHGCNAVQGYLLGRPAPARQVEQLLADPTSDFGLQGPLEAAGQPPGDDLDSEVMTVVADAVTADHDIDQVIRALLTKLQQVTGVEAVYLTLIDWDREREEVVFAHNVGGLEIPEGAMIDWSDSLCGRMLLDGARSVDDVPGTYPDSNAAKALRLRSYLSAPLFTADGKLFGTLCAASGGRARHAAGTLAVMDLFARIIADQPLAGALVTAGAAMPRR